MINWQATPSVLPLLLNFMIATALTVVSWRRQPTPGARAIAILTAGIAAWSLIYAFSLWTTQSTLALFLNTVIGLILIWAVFRFRLLDVQPMNRNLTSITTNYTNHSQAKEDQVNNSKTDDSHAEDGKIQALSGQVIELQTLLEKSQHRIAELEQMAQSHTEEMRLTLARQPQMPIDGLAEAQQQLKELDQLKHEFISHVNHQLRTPLTNITLYLNLLENGKEERRERYLAILQRETEELRRLVDATLDLSRLNDPRNKGVFKHIRIDFAEIVHSAIESSTLQTEMSMRKVAYQRPERPIYIHGDRNQLVQVVTNLLTNAVNYSASGDTITIVVEPIGDNAHLSISDMGIGVPIHELPKIFDRFYRGKKASQSGLPGAGLGLSIVKEIVELHGGIIDVHGREPGTTFNIWLPKRDDIESIETMGSIDDKDRIDSIDSQSKTEKQEDKI